MTAQEKQLSINIADISDNDLRERYLEVLEDLLLPAAGKTAKPNLSASLKKKSNKLQIQGNKS